MPKPIRVGQGHLFGDYAIVSKMTVGDERFWVMQCQQGCEKTMNYPVIELDLGDELLCPCSTKLSVELVEGGIALGVTRTDGATESLALDFDDGAAPAARGPLEIGSGEACSRG